MQRGGAATWFAQPSSHSGIELSLTRYQWALTAPSAQEFMHSLSVRHFQRVSSGVLSLHEPRGSVSRTSIAPAQQGN